MSDAYPSIGDSPERNEAANVIVRGSAAGFAQEILRGSHRLRADEPTVARRTRTQDHRTVP